MEQQPQPDVIDFDSPEYKQGRWILKAICVDEDPELFFPIGNTGPALLQIQEAKQVCRKCPVRDACLQWALEKGYEHGVWGGMSEDERRALKRRGSRQRKSKKPSPAS
jgi:WhiB family redox-sensing transcriptional regulator